jgi:hypothetical protein
LPANPARFWCIHGLAIEARDSLRDVFYARAIAHSCFLRPSAASTIAAEDELPFTNAVGKLNACDRDRGVRE